VNKLAYDIALWRVKGIGPKTFFLIKKKYPNVVSFFKEINSVDFLTDDIKRQIIHCNWKQVERDMLWLESSANHHIISFFCKDYPPWLAMIDDPPPLLYVRGNKDVFRDVCLSVVGSRSATLSGQNIAFQWSKDLACSGVTVVSGLALGIDSCAHRGAIQANNGKTIAFLPSSVDRVYPRCHASLAEQIVDQGALVSEFPLGTSIHPSFFYRRNRLISGMSRAVLLVESREKSGSLITIRHALAQGRDVMAVPGSVFCKQKNGCHRIIKEGALLVCSSQDVMNQMGGGYFVAKKMKALSLEGNEKSIYDALEQEENSIEILLNKTNLPIQEILATLSQLERNYLVKRGVCGYCRV
jgi:DNA processing protein